MTPAISESERSPVNPESQSRKMWDWFKDKLLSNLIMLVLGLAIGSWWNNASPHLSYAISEPIKFSGQKEEFVLFVLNLFSDGKKAAEHVQCEVDLGDCIIEDIKGEPAILNPKITKSRGKATIEIPSLNATEQVELAIKASAPKDSSKPRTVTLRAKDAVGVMKATSEKGRYWDGFVAGFNLVALVAFGLVVWFAISVMSTVLKVYKSLNEAHNKLDLANSAKHMAELRMSSETLNDIAKK